MSGSPAFFASAPAARTAASDASTGRSGVTTYQTFTADAPREARYATPVFALSASFRNMNCRSPGRFSQKSIVERSGPAAFTRGASESFSARAARSRDHAYPPTSKTEVTPEQT